MSEFIVPGEVVGKFLQPAQAINWAIIRGEHESGVTIMQVIRKMDSGAIIMHIFIIALRR